MGRKHSQRKLRQATVSPDFHRAIKTLCKMKGNQRCHALNKASNKFITDISQTLSKARRIPIQRIHPSLRKQIHSRRKALRAVVNRKTSIKRKRKLLTQKGGLLPLAIPLLKMIVPTLAGSIFGKIVGK